MKKLCKWNLNLLKLIERTSVIESIRCKIHVYREGIICETKKNFFKILKEKYAFSEPNICKYHLTVNNVT